MNEKLYEIDLLKRLTPGTVLLRPLQIKSATPEFQTANGYADAGIELAFPDEPERFPFLVEAKTQNTPLAIHNAIAEVRRYVAAYKTSDRKPYPMIFVPYLSPERLDDLEREQISGVDMCGNGLIIVPGRLYILRRQYPNRYSQPKPLNNPYAGRSSLVARMLLKQPTWNSLNDLVSAIKLANGEISKPQASKAISALEEDLIVWKNGLTISLKEPALLMDKLGQAFEKPTPRRQQALRLPPGTDWGSALSRESSLKNWAVTGESSVGQYTMFAQAGPRQVAVSDLMRAIQQLPCTPEPVPNFADIELLEIDDAGIYYQTKIDEKNVRWASRLQTWLELQAGDARQQDAARNIREQILKGTKLAVAR